MNNYIVTAEMQKASNPEQTIRIFQLAAGNFPDVTGGLHGMKTLPDLLAVRMNDANAMQWRQNCGINITTKPHKEPSLMSAHMLINIYSTPEGPVFWRHLDEVVKFRVRQLKEKQHEQV